jgi:hypothetical protein
MKRIQNVYITGTLYTMIKKIATFFYTESFSGQFYQGFFKDFLQNLRLPEYS